MDAFKPDEYWQSIITDQDSDLDLAYALLALYSGFHKGLSLFRYVSHLSSLSDEVSKRFDSLVEEGANNDARTRLAALKHIIHDAQEYMVANDDEADITESCDLIRAIDNRSAHAGILALLYIRTAQSLGWQAEILSMPDHYICRLIHEGEYIIFHPVEGCMILEAPDLRKIIKDTLGQQAELSNAYFKPLPKRDFLIKVLNPLKNRYIEAGDYKFALDLVKKMRELAPYEYRLLFDAGVLNARIGKDDDAISDLEDYIDMAPNARDRDDAYLLLNELIMKQE
tara:strand:- start:518 stop:1366 length:849 start_codon:yes stop_codon:yes gene_type:complete